MQLAKRGFVYWGGSNNPTVLLVMHPRLLLRAAAATVGMIVCQLSSLRLPLSIKSDFGDHANVGMNDFVCNSWCGNDVDLPTKQWCIAQGVRYAIFYVC